MKLSQPKPIMRSTWGTVVWGAVVLAWIAVPVIVASSSNGLRELTKVSLIELVKDRVGKEQVLAEDFDLSPDGRIMLVSFSAAPGKHVFPKGFISAEIQKFVIAVDHREKVLEAMCARSGFPTLKPYLSANELSFIGNESAVFSSLDEIGAIRVRGEQQCRSVAPHLTGRFPGKRKMVKAVAASRQTDFFSVAVQESPEGKDMPRGWFALPRPRLLNFSKLSGELQGDCELPIYVSVLSASTDGRFIAVGDSYWPTEGNVSVAIVEAKSCQPVSVVRLPHPVGDVHFFPDGKRFAATTSSPGKEAAVQIFDTLTGNEIKRFRYAPHARGRHHPLFRFAISPSGKWIVIASGQEAPAHSDEVRVVDSGIQLWDVDSGTLKAEVKFTPWPVQVRFFSDDTRIAVLTRDLVVRVFEITEAP